MCTNLAIQRGPQNIWGCDFLLKPARSEDRTGLAVLGSLGSLLQSQRGRIHQSLMVINGD